MAATKVRYEQRSIILALETYLTTAGWTNVVYRDGWQPDNTITNPQVAITFPPSTFIELQLGKGVEKLFLRRVQIDAYMESEPRAQAIIDDIMDFFDTECVTIVDPSGNTLGYIQCQDSQTIYGEVLQPVLGQPKFIRWRGITRCEMEAFYPAP